jgi:hypothetical protein
MSTGRHFQNGRHNTTGIVVAILKMATGRNFSMSGIKSGHHNLPTYEMSLKSDNAEFVRYYGGHFKNGQFCIFNIFEMCAIFKMGAKTQHKKCVLKIQHCPISSKFDMWVDIDSRQKFCPVVPEICHGQVHEPRKERKENNNNN